MDNPPVIDVLYPAGKIAARIDELAIEIAAHMPKDLLVVAVLKGSFMFAADLIRALHRAGLSPEVEFIFLGSYHGGTTSSGVVKILKDVETDVAGRAVLIVDDILESGRTLSFASDLMRERHARQVACCVLLDKPVRRAVQIEPDFTGFECPDLFVIGYGMDLDHRFRELPYVGHVVDTANTGADKPEPLDKND